MANLEYMYSSMCVDTVSRINRCRKMKFKYVVVFVKSWDRVLHWALCDKSYFNYRT